MGYLIYKSLYHYRKSHLWLLFAVTIISIIISGSLILGDSLKFSLEKLLLDRIGKIRWYVYSGNRFFNDAIAKRLTKVSGESVSAPILLNGTASNPNNKIRINNIQIVGYDDNKEFWGFDNECICVNEKIC